MLRARGLRVVGARARFPRMQRRWVGEETGFGALSAQKERRTVFRPKEGYGYDPLSNSSLLETQVDSYSRTGFVVNGVALRGPVLLLSELSFLFSVPRFSELTPESLSILTMLESPIDLLVIGCGRSVQQRLPPGVEAWLNSQSIAPELFATRQACSHFNFMIQERRSAAAVLFPLDDGIFDVDDELPPTGAGGVRVVDIKD